MDLWHDCRPQATLGHTGEAVSGTSRWGRAEIIWEISCINVKYQQAANIGIPCFREIESQILRLNPRGCLKDSIHIYCHM